MTLLQINWTVRCTTFEGDRAAAGSLLSVLEDVEDDYRIKSKRTGAGCFFSHLAFRAILTVLAGVDAREEGQGVGFTQALQDGGPPRQRRLLQRTRDPVRAQHFCAVGLLDEFLFGK